MKRAIKHRKIAVLLIWGNLVIYQQRFSLGTYIKCFFLQYNKVTIHSLLFCSSALLHAGGFSVGVILALGTLEETKSH